MPVLTHFAIKKALETGEIKITPNVSDDQISVASVDLTLGNDFWVYEKQLGPVPIKESTNYLDLTRHIQSEEMVIKPQETLIGITKEKLLCLVTFVVGLRVEVVLPV